MTKLVDEAIGFLPENIQRELNDAWARGLSSPYTRVADPLNAALLNRAQTIRGMKMEIAALKAQRDELLEALKDVIGWVPGNWHTDAPRESVKRARAAIAKANGAREVNHG